MLEDDLIQFVDAHLRALADVDVAEACRSTLHREEHIEDERVLAVVIEAACCILGIVLGGIEHVAQTELAEMQDLHTVFVSALVIPIDDLDLLVGVHCVLVLVLSRGHSGSCEIVLDLGIHLLSSLTVDEFHVEQIAAFLNVCDAGLPIEVE